MSRSVVLTAAAVAVLAGAAACSPTIGRHGFQPVDVTPAEIEAAVVAGLYRAFGEGGRALTDGDLRAALAESPPLSRSRAAELTRLQQWAVTNARAA